MQCLRCRGEAMRVERRGHIDDPLGVVEIDICPQCAGMWLDALELNALAGSLFTDLEGIALSASAPTAEDAQLHCPRCAGAPPLDKCHPLTAPDVVVDRCGSCHGFWLDKGELDKLERVHSDQLVAVLLGGEP